MFEWLASGVAKSILGVFGDSIVKPFIDVWLKSKDVDLEKFKTAEVSTEQLAVAVLDANVRFAQVKSQYVLAVLQWWPFRIVLFIILSVCAARFCIVLFDSTWWWMFGCTIEGKHILGDKCSWSIPAIRGTYANVEVQFLLFWVVAKPVDTAVTGAINLVGKYLNRK